MIAGGNLIEECFRSGIWTFESVDNEPPHIGPNSCDVRLNSHFLVMKDKKSPKPFDIVSDPDSKKLYDQLELDEIILNPGDFVLACSMERVDCSQTVGIKTQDEITVPMQFTQHYDGRSTLARLGLLSHVSAGFGDFNFKGAFTLELKNLGKFPLILKKGMRIGQIYFEQTVFPKQYEGYDQTDFKPAYPRTGGGRF